jgi:hypothetical protein
VEVLEADAFRCYPIDVGARLPVIAITAQMIGPLGVDVDIEDPLGDAILSPDRSFLFR